MDEQCEHEMEKATIYIHIPDYPTVGNMRIMSKETMVCKKCGKGAMPENFLPREEK